MENGPKMMWDLLLKEKALYRTRSLTPVVVLGLRSTFRMKGVIEVSNIKLNSSGKLMDVLGVLPGGELNKAKLFQCIYFLKA